MANITAAENARRRLSALELVAQVQSIISSGDDAEMCIWRLVDAAGLLASTVPAARRAELIGLAQTTGRGYRLTTSGAMPSAVAGEWRGR